MWTDRSLLALLGLGLGVRVVVLLWLEPEMAFKGDEHVYTKHARDLIETGVFDTGWFVRPPLYFLFLAGTGVFADALSVSWMLVTKILQCLASVATAIPIYCSARRVAGTRAARLAAGFFLFDPTLIAYTHLLWPETLFLLLVAIVFDGVSGLDRRGPGRSVMLGAATGLAMLFKPVFGLFALLLAGSWLIQLGWTRTLRQILIFGGTAALVISPWVIRNQLAYGSSIVLENQGPYNLWTGNSTDPPKQVLRDWRHLPDPVVRSRVATERGVEAVVSDPVRFASNYASRAVNLWGLEFFVYRHLVGGGYGWVTRDSMVSVFWLLQVGWAIVWICACVGMSRAVRDPTLRLIGVYALTFTLMVAALVGTTRFRVPFAFLLAIAAGIGVDRALAGRLTRRALAAVVLAIAVLGFSAARPIFWMLITNDFVNAGDVNQVEDWMWFRY